MNGRLLAAVATDIEQTRVMELELPAEPAPDAGLLRVEAAGVCGSDARFYRLPGGPRILGHENVGRIERLGPLAAARWNVATGDRVALEEFLPCGRCAHCRAGDYRFCPETDVFLPGGVRFGWSPLDLAPGLWGGYAQYLHLPPNTVLHRIPEDLPGPVAALALPLSNGIQWMQIEAGVGSGATVLVQGPGSQGMSCVLAALDAGAARVIVSGLHRDEQRFAVARRLDPERVFTVDVEREDLVERVRQISDGELADVVADTSSGGADPIRLALEAVRPRGTVILAAFKGRPVPELLTDRICAKGLTVKGMRGHSHAAVRRAVRLLASRRYPFADLTTHVLPLAEVDRAIRMLGSDPTAIRITIDPWR